MRVPKFSSVLWMSGLLSGLLAGITSFHTSVLRGLILGLVTLFLLVTLGPRRPYRKPLLLLFAVSGFALAATGTLLLETASPLLWIGVAAIMTGLCITWVLDELENR